MKLTKRAIDAVTYQGPAPRRDVRWDDTLPGFGLRVYPTGKKAFVLSYRSGGRKRLLTIGQYGHITLAEAITRARKTLATVLDGDDPVETRRAQAQAATVNELAREYIELYAKRHKRTWEKDEATLRNDVLPALGIQRLENVNRRDIATLLDRIVQRGAPIQANRTLACVRRMFNFAVERGLMDVSPASHIRAPSPEAPRMRVLSDDEIAEFWQALHEYSGTSEPMRRALKLILLTAQRPGEVAAMRADEINGHWWTIPAERAKNGIEHRVPMSETALSLAESDTTPYLLSAFKGRPLTVSGIDRALSRLVEKHGWPHFTPHDLRRTAATRLGELGYNRLIQDKILNHKDRSMGGIYDRYSYDKEKRAALEAWDRKLRQIVTGEQPSNVVPLFGESS
ncbi:tyrosine-type recombinase/integrase [Salinisphaera sp. SWV1]|uniref:tyrosine-type recombinase/integrase n=1 Tax=Salinisphaera sp. SWV1 TaxID=3454139 RepID=UPI003F8479BC